MINLKNGTDFEELTINNKNDISALVKFDDGVCNVNIKGRTYGITIEQYNKLKKELRNQYKPPQPQPKRHEQKPTSNTNNILLYLSSITKQNG